MTTLRSNTLRLRELASAPRYLALINEDGSYSTVSRDFDRLDPRELEVGERGAWLAPTSQERDQ